MQTFVRILTVVLVAVLFAVPFAQPCFSKSALEKKMEQNRNKRDKLYDYVRELNKDEHELASRISALDQRIELKMSEIAAIESQLETAEQELEELRMSQDECSALLDSCQDKLKQRARAVYMEGELTYADILLQAANVNELLDRMFFIQGIVKHDRSLVSTMRERQDELVAKEEQVAERVESIRQIREVLDAQKRELEQFKNEKQLSVQAINQDRELYLKQIEELERENVKIADEIREIARSASGYSGNWTGSFSKPCSGKITSPYGIRTHPIFKTKKMHTGVDIAAAKGTAVHAAGEGKVIYTGTRGGYGKTVIVDHGGSRTTLYAHMSRITCDAGDILNASTKIGEVGSTGISTGNHLHFEVRINGETVDPLKELK